MDDHELIVTTDGQELEEDAAELSRRVDRRGRCIDPGDARVVAHEDPAIFVQQGCCRTRAQARRVHPDLDDACRGLDPERGEGPGRLRRGAYDERARRRATEVSMQRRLRFPLPPCHGPRHHGPPKSWPVMSLSPSQMVWNFRAPLGPIKSDSRTTLPPSAGPTTEDASLRTVIRCSARYLRVSGVSWRPMRSRLRSISMERSTLCFAPVAFPRKYSSFLPSSGSRAAATPSMTPPMIFPAPSRTT